MKSDINGRSTCEDGEEQYELFYSPTIKRDLVQYDYRTSDGKLFSCIAPSLEKARIKRDKWLSKA